jgi:hypothetical protein
MRTHAGDPDHAGRGIRMSRKNIPIQGCSHCPGEQRSAERTGAPAYQAQDQTAGPREQGVLSGQAFHNYLFTVIEDVCYKSTISLRLGK